MNRHDEIVESVAATLLAEGLARPTNLIGCSQPEIRALEETLNIRLPSAYRAFLSRMGKSAGDLWLGSDAFLDSLEQMQVWTKEMLAEANRPGGLPADSFTFLMHQGYVAFYFRLSEGDDPPVYHLTESNAISTKFADHFTEFLVSGLKECIAMRATRVSFRKKHGLSDLQS